MTTNLKVKVILGNDIRRWRYDKSESKLSSLKEFVSASFNITDFWLQYEDDEGDRLTLSSDNDFEDAFTCAQEEDRKSLKIYVIQGSINAAQQKMRKSSMHSQPQSHPPSSPQHGPCHPDPDCDVNKCFEMKAVAIDFLQNPEIVKLLPDLHRRLFEELRKKKQESEEAKEPDNNLPKWDSPAMIETIFRSILTEDKFQPIINHDLYSKKLDSMIPHIAHKISSHLPILMNFSCEAIAAWIPHLANVMAHGFNTFSCFGGSDMDMPSAMSSFFPLMCSFMAQHGDYSGLSGFCDSQDRDSNGEVIHRGVQCDSCNTRPIKGARFKCLKCSNFDLCGQCESFGKHDPSHPMIKFNHSARTVGPPPFDGFHEIMRHFGNPHHGPHPHGPPGPHGWFGSHHHGHHHRRGGWKKWHRWNQQNQGNNQQSANNNDNGGFQPHPHGPPPHAHPGMGHPPPHHPGWWNQDGDAHWGHRGHRTWKRWNKWQQNGNCNNDGNDPWDMHNWQQWCDNRQNNGNGNNDNASVISSTIANTMNKHSNNSNNDNNNNKKNENEKKIKVMADFVKDVTLPDRTYYPTDTVLTKTWKMRNNGEHEWGNNVELVFFKGNESLTLEKRYPVINAKPGQEVEVSAVIKTPDKPGRYCSYYRLQRNGEYFGPRVWVDIFAVDEENTQELNRNIEPKWKKYAKKGKKNKKDNKGKNDKDKQKEKQQDMKIKLEKKEAKLEAKQEKLQAKQRKIAEQLSNVSQQLDTQNENENSSKLVKKQEKLQRQQDKVKSHMDKIKNKSNGVAKRRQKIVQNEISKNANNNINDNAPVIIDEEQLLADIANAAVQDLDFEQKQQHSQNVPNLPIHPIHPVQPILPPQHQIPSQVMACICGATLHKTTPIQAYSHGAQVNCDICGKFCPAQKTIYHCPIRKSMAHPEGYDLCVSCAEYQMQGFIAHQPAHNQQQHVQQVQVQQPQQPAQQQPQPQPQMNVNAQPFQPQHIPQGLPMMNEQQMHQHQLHQQQMLNMNTMLMNNGLHQQQQQHSQQVMPPPVNVNINVPPQPEPFVYQQQLEQLRAMGFNDEEQIKAELIQQKGNVQRVTHRLLQQQ